MCGVGSSGGSMFKSMDGVQATKPKAAAKPKTTKPKAKTAAKPKKVCPMYRSELSARHLLRVHRRASL